MRGEMTSQDVQTFLNYYWMFFIPQDSMRNTISEVQEESGAGIGEFKAVGAMCQDILSIYRP